MYFILLQVTDALLQSIIIEYYSTHIQTQQLEEVMMSPKHQPTGGP